MCKINGTFEECDDLIGELAMSTGEIADIMSNSDD